MSSREIISSTEVVRRVLSSAYHLLVSLRPQEAMSYPLPEAVRYLVSGSTIRSNRSGDKGSPCRVPRRIPTGEVCPCGVMNFVVAPLYRFETSLVKSEGRPRNSSTRTSSVWSMEGNALIKVEVTEDDVLLVGEGVLHT